MADLHPTARMNYVTNTAPLDAYFQMNAAGPDHRRRVALAVWDNMAPEARLELQHTARALSGADLRLAQTMAESMLLLHSF